MLARAPYDGLPNLPLEFRQRFRITKSAAVLWLSVVNWNCYILYF